MIHYELGRDQRVVRTAARRLGFDAVGFMNITGHILSTLSAAIDRTGLFWHLPRFSRSVILFQRTYDT